MKNVLLTLSTLLVFALAGCGSEAERRHDDDHTHGASETPAAGNEDDHAHGEEGDAHAHADEGDDHGHGDDHGPEATTIPAAIAQRSGIVVAGAAGGTIRDEHEVQGLLTTVEGRHARVVARFAGPVTAVDVGVGDVVRKGQRLATVESNVSLSGYAIVAPIGGTVLARNTGVGDLAGEQPLFELADLSTLWVDLHLFGADAQHITPGLPVEVTRLSDGVRAQTTLDRVLPGTATASQSTVARATIRNEDGRWRPGAAVRARVTVDETPVALMVPLSALQRADGRDVVYVQQGERFEARPVTLGARDGRNVEIRDGLVAHEWVVVEQSYLVKADIEKSGAAHEH